MDTQLQRGPPGTERELLLLIAFPMYKPRLLRINLGEASSCRQWGAWKGCQQPLEVPAAPADEGSAFLFDSLAGDDRSGVGGVDWQSSIWSARIREIATYASGSPTVISASAE